MTLVVQAQKSPELDYALRFSDGITTAQTKYLQEGLLDQDPGAELWVDAPTNSALFRIHGVLNVSALQEYVANGGLQIMSVRQVLTARPDVILGVGGTRSDHENGLAPE